MFYVEEKSRWRGWYLKYETDSMSVAMREFRLLKKQNPKNTYRIRESVPQQNQAKSKRKSNRPQSKAMSNEGMYFSTSADDYYDDDSPY